LGDQGVRLQRELEHLGIFGLSETRRREFIYPIPYRVVVEGQAVEIPAPCVVLIGLHHRVGPLLPSRAIAARPYSELQHLVLAMLLRWIVVADIVSGVLA